MTKRSRTTIVRFVGPSLHLNFNLSTMSSYCQSVNYGFPQPPSKVLMMLASGAHALQWRCLGFSLNMASHLGVQVAVDNEG